MTIDDAMNHIKYGIVENNYPLQRDLEIEACNLAIETMRKYQQIERIFRSWCEVGDDGDISAFRDLKQVICPCTGGKDGNDRN